jgi:hypothetical protein
MSGVMPTGTQSLVRVRYDDKTIFIYSYLNHAGESARSEATPFWIADASTARSWPIAGVFLGHRATR